ncbi:hypothetical protein K503DRAFT_803736 [Rhizopogon vinicolor AM-OR11-026]|uniref:REJ domain-containing protein n=1 Tax=Rhizopogon vinicolor AM-OR11-026 TaxID=1314800 RepID=A0A1B7MNT4_9AGAM|nr:hypothetical protein K503DRAFT_803736 [Rhizopogon vinicolor AM-OR11-026]
METSTSTVSSTATITIISSSTYSYSSSHTTSTSSSSTVSISTSTAIPAPSTLFIYTTKVDDSSSTAPTTARPSTLILTSVLSHTGTTTWTTTTSGVLSTEGVSKTANGLSSSPGSIAGLVLGILGAIAFATLWLSCARRRHRQLIHDASAIPPWATGPLETEVDMEEPYAEILAALNAGMGAGRNAHIEGDTSGEISGELAMPHSSSPTLPLYSLPPERHHDGLYMFPLSPPPSTYVPAPPPSAYVPPPSSKSPWRRSSPGPDASAWFAGHNIAPTSSVTSHHSNSTSNVLSRTETGTRTRTGSEEPLLSRVGSGSSYLDSGHKIRLGSAFGSPKGSVSGHNHNLSPSSDRRSNTISSFGALRSVSSGGALRSMSSHGYEFGFGSASSGTGSHRGPALGLAISGGPISYKSRRAIKWTKGKRESTGSSISATSAYGSADEKPAGVRAFLGRLRLRNSPSPKASSLRDLESEGMSEKRNSGAPGQHTSPQAFSAVLSPATPPLEPTSLPTSPRFVLSNPDPQPHSPYVNIDAQGALQGHEDGLQPPTWPWLGHAPTNTLPPSPAHTLESRSSAAEGLLDPRLRENVEGRSNASLRDFEDYSRPIGGLVNNRMHSTTTFGTADSLDGMSVRNQEDDQQEEVGATATSIPRSSWVVDDFADDFHAY